MMNTRNTIVGHRSVGALLTSLALAACVSAGNAAGAPAPLNGFALTNPQVPVAEIRSGGQPRDGIPAIDRPVFVAASGARHLRDDDLVVSFSHGGETRAYPLRILVWHEIVNDTVGGRPVAVTYCPLCGTAMVFDRRTGQRTLTFGVSGLLYQSDVLMYDRQSDSLWSQLAMKSVTGPLAGTEITWLASEHLTFGAWRVKHPEGRVLSARTGFQRDYSAWPYEDYEASDRTMFPVARHRADLSNKAWVVGLVSGGNALAFPLNRLPSGQPVPAVGGESRVELTFDAASESVRVRDADTGEAVPSVKAYWFAWQAFYPKTKVWRP
jgi:hypothetical protein